MVKFSEEIKKKRNYYDVLGVSQEAKFEELETNYELMKKNLLVEKNNLKREKKKLILEGGFKLEKEKLLRAEERVKRAYSILKDPA